MDTRRLRHFLAVYETGSLGQAATELHLTQPALSKSLKQLEDELQVKLFDRTPLGVVPTAFGEALAIHAKVVQSEIRSAETQIAMLRGAARGHVIVGIGPSIADNLMPTVTARLNSWRPGVQLTVVEGLVEDLIPALRRGELDLAISTWPIGADSDLTSESIFSDEVVILAGSQHPLARGEPKIEDLLKYPWALPAQKHFWRHQLDDIFLSHGHAPPVAVVTSNSATYLRSLLLAGNFLSYLPHRLIVPEEKAGRVMPLAIKTPPLRLDITLTYRERSAMTAATKALLTVLRDIVKTSEPRATATTS